MTDQPSVTLDQIRQALAQPNQAIWKRALALIHNEAKVEAGPILEEYLGREQDASLQALALKVLEKLKSFRECAGQVPTERLTPLLQNPDPQARLMGLRAAATRNDADLAKMVVRHCAGDVSPEARQLIAQILRTNPLPEGIPILLDLVSEESEKIREDAIEGILQVITRRLYPEVLKTLLDPSPALKMRAYQLISRISRQNLLEALESMLGDADPAISRLGGKLLPSFLNPDLISLLARHVDHRDAETAALCKRSLVLLAQKGHFEAAQLVEKFTARDKPCASPAGASSQVSGTCADAIRGLKDLLIRFPFFLQAPFLDLPSNADISQTILRIRDLHSRIRTLIAGPLLTTYFGQGRRSQACDRIAFKALQQGTRNADLPALITGLAPAFDTIPDETDLYPIMIVVRSKTPPVFPLYERLVFFQKTIPAMNSGSADPSALFTSLVQGAVELLKSLEIMLPNRMVVKCSDAAGIRVLDFMKNPPVAVDPRLLVNFDLPLHDPTLISGNSSCAMSLSPFLKYAPETRILVANDPGEHDLWEYLMKLKILDSYLAYLKEKTA
ncbi:MAG TPA: hypothetical protein PLU72_10430 [Candidatus Ozemobacteraceae bacterium]|nr:hypothetical protein [Candidatus Ozemobacteraceae bacterium]